MLHFTTNWLIFFLSHSKFAGLWVFGALDWCGFNDSSAPLAKLSTWQLCHIFGVFVTLNLHIIESGDYGVEKLPRDKLATLLKWCILFHLYWIKSNYINCLPAFQVPRGHCHIFNAPFHTCEAEEKEVEYGWPTSTHSERTTSTGKHIQKILKDMPLYNWI